MTAKYGYFEDRIKKVFEQRRFQQLRCIVPHELKLTGTFDFTSYDFLGLTTHDFVKKQSIKAVLKWGAGSTASRRINGHIEFQQTLESKIAKEMGFEEALFFSSTLQAHMAILPVLITKQTHVFIDRFASPFFYSTLSQFTQKITRYEHNNIHDLERHLHKHADVPSHQKIVITESLFTATGDYAPLRGLIDVTTRQNTLLYVDDSNTMGVKGQSGLGHCALRRGIDCVVGSFGKAAGCFGAFVTLPTVLKDYITSSTPSLLSIPPLPPAVLGGIDASLTLIPNMNHERTTIDELADYTRSSLGKIGLEYRKSCSHIIPITFESDETKQKMAEYLEEHSIYLQTSEKKLQDIPALRIFISAWHTREDIDALCSALAEGMEALSISKPTLATAYTT